MSDKDYIEKAKKISAENPDILDDPEVAKGAKWALQELQRKTGKSNGKLLAGLMKRDPEIMKLVQGLADDIGDERDAKKAAEEPPKEEDSTH